MDTLRVCLFWCIIGLCLINICLGLECYVCDKQKGNDEKCMKTIKVCEPGDDMCLTDFRWGSTPYWELGAPKQYYVSKRCATKNECERERKDRMPYCNYVWYLDWKCSDCCSGDRCNYFVILSGSLAKASAMVLSISLLSVFAVGRWIVG